jgi:hypothetical protein
MAIEVEHVRPAGLMIGADSLPRLYGLIKHDPYLTLCFVRSGRIIDIGDEKSLDPLTQAVDGIARAVAQRLATEGVRAHAGDI